MNFVRAALLLAAFLPIAAQANDYPTPDRVEYVLECMNKNQGKHEFLYKCSCAIDRIAKELKYDEYVDMSTALRHQTLGGERGGVFRDPDNVKKAARGYRTIQAEAEKSCSITSR